ncbi:MAG: baseplate J/gp47 family protein [Bacillota bacterium]
MHRNHIIIISIGVIIIAILGWIYFIYPAVIIEVSPEVNIVKKELMFKSSLNKNEIDREKRIIPLKMFEVSVKDSYSTNVSGEKKKGTRKAKGKVKFINESKEEVKVPQGTVVKTGDGIKYKTEEKAVVPALQKDFIDEVQVGVKAGEVEVPIVSVNEGTSANVDSGKIDQIEEDGFKKLYVINPESVSGGKDSEVSVVSENDIDRLKQKMREQIKSDLITQIYKKFSKDYRIVDNDVNIGDIDYVFEQQPGDQSDVLEGTIKLNATGYIISDDYLEKMIYYTLDEELKENYAGNNVLAIDLEELEDELYNVKLELEVFTVPEIDIDNLRERIAGLKLKEVKEILQKNEDIKKVRIKTDKEYLPGMDFAINVVIKNPEKELLNYMRP